MTENNKNKETCKEMPAKGADSKAAGGTPKDGDKPAGRSPKKEDKLAGCSPKKEDRASKKDNSQAAGGTPKKATEKDGDKVVNYLTMFGHLCSDINQGALSAVLPFLVAYNGYSYFEVTMVLFFSNIASAVIQPLFGWIGDRHACPWFMAVGTFLAGLGMFGIGYLGNYSLVLVSALVSGIGIAMFHPEGGRLANLSAGKSKARALSIFAVGGSTGFFVGPTLCAIFLTAFGMHGTAVFLVPAIICPIVLLFFERRFKALGVAVQRSSGSKEDATPERWGAFSLLMVVLSLRSIISYGLLAFIPLFVMNVIGCDETTSSLVLSAFSVAGAVATFLSGRASDAMGSYKLLIVCLISTIILCAAFSQAATLAIAIALALLLAISSDICHPSTIAIGMSYVPHHLGMASGISYGVTVCVGGVAEPFLGMAGDSLGLPAVMLILAAITAVATVLSIIVWRMKDGSGARAGGASGARTEGASKGAPPSSKKDDTI